MIDDEEAMIDDEEGDQTTPQEHHLQIIKDDKPIILQGISLVHKTLHEERYLPEEMKYCEK